MTGEAVEVVGRPYPIWVTPEVLAYIGLQTNDPLIPLTILLADRYGLDPALGHLEVIQASGKRRLYITRDGYVDIAHRSSQLDGIVLEDVSHGESGWRATVSVWRRDMRYPFTYSAGCGDDESEAHEDGEAMAIARAERRALKRAFPVVQAIEYQHGLLGDDVEASPPPYLATTPVPRLDAPPVRAEPRGPRWRPSVQEQRDAHKALSATPLENQAAFLERHRIDAFGHPWPAEAVAEVLGITAPQDA
jgi:hypothetical protein